MNQEKVTALLKRIGIETIPLKSNGSKAGEKDAQILEVLIRGYLEHVPFENLDVFDAGRIPVLEEDALFEKIVEKRRGGYCFELNTLLGHLLEALGFSWYPVAVRVLWNRENIPPVSHMGIVVPMDKNCYYCDVGFGGPGPKGLLELSEKAQTIAGESFLVHLMQDRDIRIDRQQDNTWKPLLQFRNLPVRNVDFQIMNYYCATHPDVLFTQKRVVNICTPNGSKALTDMELTVRDNGCIRQETYCSPEELAAGLEKEFGIQNCL